MAFVSSLIALSSLEERLPFLREALADRPSARDFLSGFLASITLVLFQSFLPGIVDALARYEGLQSESQIQKWCLGSLFIFQVVVCAPPTLFCPDSFFDFDAIGGVCIWLELLFWYHYRWQSAGYCEQPQLHSAARTVGSSSAGRQHVLHSLRHSARSVRLPNGSAEPRCAGH